MTKCYLPFLLVFFCLAAQAQQLPERISFNAGWEFVKDIDSSKLEAMLLSKKTSAIVWQKVSLPHTPRLESVIKTTEEQWQGDCYYRKIFTIPVSDKDKNIEIGFDGAMHEATIYLNGTQVFKHAGGYLPFYVDISNAVKFGKENRLLVKLNNQDNPAIPPSKPMKELDFNFYGGLYRNTWLIVKNKLHISNAVNVNHEAGGGILVRCEGVTKSTATMVIKTELENNNAATAAAQVKIIVKNNSGKQVATGLSSIETIQNGTFVSVVQRLTINNPSLWSPTHPNLYTLNVQVIQDGKKADEEAFKTGIKKIHFEAGAFFINGEKLNIVGTNRHQEYPYIGYALPDDAQYRDAYKIKSAGLNLVRCSHYPPSPAFLDACDELGILVIDAIPGWQFFGGETFQQNSFQNIRDMIHRDRNHASIVMWEASLNETDMSKPFMDKAQQIVHNELPFEEVYTAGWEDYAFDVFIPARQHGKEPVYWKNYDKKKPLLTAEYGDWEYYAQNAGFDQTNYKNLKKEERNSRQLRPDGQERMLQQALNFQEAHNDNMYGPQVGDAGWVMFDYKRGYATDIQSSGLMDIYRLPKFVFYFFQSQYGPVADDKGFGKPMLFIANYWKGAADTNIKIFSNCDEVELFINGIAVAKQKAQKDNYATNLPHPPFSFHIAKWSPGKLKAVGYINEKKVVESVVATPGGPYKITLLPDESGKNLSTVNDIIFVYARVMDERGTVVPDAANLLQFTVKGGGKIIGDTAVKAEAGIATILIKKTDNLKDIIISTQSAGLQKGEFTIKVTR